MNHKAQIVNIVEKFYVDVVEEFKEAELQIMADSKFKSIFRKKDYDGNIMKLKACKKEALGLNTSGIAADDEDARGVLRQLERCLAVFNNLCDVYIQLQTALKSKANKEELSFSSYKKIFDKVQGTRERMNGELHELDIIYTDYTYDEEDEKWEMKTL